MDRVRKGEIPWMKIDVLNRLILDDLLQECNINDVSPAEFAKLNRVWHRLKLGARRCRWSARRPGWAIRDARSSAGTE